MLYHISLTHSLTQNSKFISPKFFYDQIGSKIFEDICKLPEYYLTRTEKKILEESNRIKKENCAIAQKNMQSLSSRGQVTVKDGDIYRKLSEEERQSKIQKAQSNIKEYCQG